MNEQSMLTEREDRVPLDLLCDPEIQLVDPRKTPDWEFLYVDISSVDNRLKTVTEPTRIRGADAPSRARQVIRSGDVLVATTRPNLNAVARVGSELDGQVASTGFCVLRPREPLLSEFLFLWVQSPAFVDALTELVQGALYPAVTEKQVRAQFIRLLSPAIQRQVVGRLSSQLSTLERARAALVTQVEAADAVFDALLRSTFDGASWPMVKVGSVAIVSGGIQKTPSRAPLKNHRPFLTVRNVQRGRLDLTAVERFEVTQTELDRYRLSPEDLLVVEGNGSPDHIGRNALFPAGMEEEWIHQNHIIRVRFDRSRMLPRFVSLYLNSPQGRAQMLDAAATTTGLFTLSTAKITNLVIPDAPLDTQQAIVSRVDAWESKALSLCSSLRSRLADLERLSASLLQEAFAA